MSTSIQKKNILPIIMLFSVTGVANGAAVTASTFDTGLDGWVANTAFSSVQHGNAGGNPDGYLKGITKASGTTGAVNLTSNYTDNYVSAGIKSVAVDLKNEFGTVNDAFLRFRYLDSTQNGWAYLLTNTLGTNWESFEVAFDTGWSDVDALSNGWTKDGPGVVGFSTLWTDIYTAEVRINGSAALGVGIDNYSISTSPVPVPATVWLVGSGLAGLFGFGRKGRKGRKNT